MLLQREVVCGSSVMSAFIENTSITIIQQEYISVGWLLIAGVATTRLPGGSLSRGSLFGGLCPGVFCPEGGLPTLAPFST